MNILIISLSFSLSEKLCYVPVEEGAMIEGAMDNSTFERYQRTRKVCKEGYVFEGDERIQNKGFQTIECEDSDGTMRWKYWERSNCTRKIFSYIMSFIFFYFNLYLYWLGQVILLRRISDYGYITAPLKSPFTTRWGYGGRILDLIPSVLTGDLYWYYKTNFLFNNVICHQYYIVNISE